jgi:predicted DNA-binding transcriptional regulator YafY
MSDIDHEIMRLLPDASTQADFISTPDLHKKLEQAVDDAPCKRTVQRRLYMLEQDGFVEMNRRGNAVVWRRLAGAGGIAARAGSLMTFDEALALQTLRRFSSRQIPELVSGSLNSLFAVAQARLSRTQSELERKYARWASKVEIESPSFPLQSPPIDRAVFAEVSQALFEERKLDIVYRSRSNGGSGKQQIILPLGLVEVGTLVYLIGKRENKPAPYMYRVDRLDRAEVMFESFDYPADFSLERYVRTQRSFDFEVGPSMQVELLFAVHAGDHLLEAPFAPDQRHEVRGNALHVKGTVALSQRLRWWLRSFGPNVEVLAPDVLRNEVREEAKALARLYG